MQPCTTAEALIYDSHSSLLESSQSQITSPAKMESRPPSPIHTFLTLSNESSRKAKMPSIPSVSSSAAATTFTLFSSLAPELRLKIWQHACHSRVVEVRYDPGTDSFRSRTPVPAILHTCREARYEGLKSYRLYFSTHTHPSHVFFNPTVDMLYLPRHRQMGYDETLRDFRLFLSDVQQLDNVRWLALDHVKIEIKRPWESYNKTVLIRSFTQLQEIFLVVSKGDTEEELEALRNSPNPRRLETGVTETLVLCKDNAHDIFRIWSNFRRVFMEESKILEQVQEDMGEKVNPFKLAALRIVERGRNREGGLDWMTPGMLPMT